MASQLKGTDTQQTTEETISESPQPLSPDCQEGIDGLFWFRPQNSASTCSNASSTSSGPPRVREGGPEEPQIDTLTIMLTNPSSRAVVPNLDVFLHGYYKVLERKMHPENKRGVLLRAVHLDNGMELMITAQPKLLDAILYTEVKGDMHYAVQCTEIVKAAPIVKSTPDLSNLYIGSWTVPGPKYIRCNNIDGTACFEKNSGGGGLPFYTNLAWNVLSMLIHAKKDPPPGQHLVSIFALNAGSSCLAQLVDTGRPGFKKVAFLSVPTEKTTLQSEDLPFFTMTTDIPIEKDAVLVENKGWYMYYNDGVQKWYLGYDMSGECLTGVDITATTDPSYAKPFFISKPRLEQF